MNKKVFIFALDGVPLNLVRKLAREGVMPNLARVLSKSSWGNLESTLPCITGPAWASFATGKNPGETGIFNFLQPAGDLDNLDIIDSRDIQGKTFYEILEKKGKKCIFINLPCSYPSRIKKGIMISSFLAGEDFYYPSNLINEIPELAKYKLAPDFVIGLDLKRGLDNIIEIEESRFRVGQKLFKKNWDLFFYLVSGTDWAMHLAFDKLIAGKADPQVVEIFKNADSYLGWFLDSLPKDAAILIMSDHGFSTTSRMFYINTWLKKMKLLNFRTSWKKSSARSLSEILIAKARPESIQRRVLQKMGLFFVNSSFFYFLLAISIRALTFLFPDLFSDKIRTIGLEIDPKKTKACALPGNAGWFGLYINDKKRFKSGIVSQKEYKELRNEIYKKLSKVLGKGNVWLREGVYKGKLAKEGPDILYCPKDIFVSTAFSKRIFKAKKDNQHSRFGFLMLAGNGVKKARKIQGAKITDLAPTIFRLLGVKKPTGMKGRDLVDNLSFKA